MTIWGGIPEAGEGAETEAVSGLDKAAGILYFLLVLLFIVKKMMGFSSTLNLDR